MVVAIDDRADVWHWSPNLIKVRPYNFFLGIGDINEPIKEEPSLDTPPIKIGETAPIISMTIIQPDHSKTPSTPKPRPILADNDQDLKHLSKALSTLHQEYFKLYSNTHKPDISIILPSLKQNILVGVHLVFSGVVPLGLDPTKSDIWILSRQFGAQCYLEITSNTTHLIAKKVWGILVYYRLGRVRLGKRGKYSVLLLNRNGKNFRVILGCMNVLVSGSGYPNKIIV
jgi:RNA polymerase II subunit A C-terminal domain phosphatase